MMISKGGAKRQAADLTEPEESANKRAKTDSVPVVSTTSGLLALPEDVFDLIFDELLAGSRLISKEHVLANQPHMEESFEYRTDVLHGLMQTCRALRKACLPKYYEHVEVCIVRGPRMWYKQLSERLEKMSLMLSECPHLAVHVRYVLEHMSPMSSLTQPARTFTVSLTRCSTGTVLPAFAACLKALPNLHTLRVMHAHSQMTTALKNAFGGTTIPQLRTLILPSCAHNILRSCPNATDVTVNEDPDGSKLISAMAKSARNVEVIDGFWITDTSAKRSYVA